jgi:Trypsin
MPASWPVVTVNANADEDVALLGIASADAAVAQGATIAAGAAGPIAIGETVEIAGYGLTADGGSGSLNFAVEPVSAVDSASITVDDHGASGACNGDSGGPLLLRGPDGAVRVEAVLSVGSVDCSGEDVYARLDAISDWILQVSGPEQVSHACGGIGLQGRCLYGSALWCEGTTLAAESCTHGTQCGWSAASGGFRCEDPSSDPCAGTDNTGACVSNAAQSCAGGRLQHSDCGCGTCVVDPMSGTPECLGG